MSRPYTGPCGLVSPVEAQFILDLIDARPAEIGCEPAEGLRAKMTAVVESHPSWRKPLR